MGEAKRYDVLRLDAQDAPIFLIVEAIGGDEVDEKQYFYEEHICPSDILHRVETVIIKGDTDPHGLFEYVRTSDELDLSGGYAPGEAWSKVVPEAFAALCSKRTNG